MMTTLNQHFEHCHGMEHAVANRVFDDCSLTNMSLCAQADHMRDCGGEDIPQAGLQGRPFQDRHRGGHPDCLLLLPGDLNSLSAGTCIHIYKELTSLVSCPSGKETCIISHAGPEGPVQA